MRRSATSDAMAALSAAQERALAALVAGETVVAAAAAAKVCRQTVHRWLREPEFQAALNATRNDVRLEMATRLEHVAASAISNVERSVGEGDTAVSLAVLRGLGLLSGKPGEVGSERAAAIRGEQKTNQMFDAIGELGGFGDG